MTAREYRDLRDRQHGTNRKKLYGSDRAHFPYPHLTSSKKKISTKISTPEGDNGDYSTKNYDNFQNVKELSNLFSK